ncbi:hypothetical protein [Nocardia mangyaensis]|uniref:hypothetical protein n=1 Tax=Nocardia mangyaensis TaxID=2213200 RepID=UPI002674C960|nr:hypothetical protein [Nocardia mangyaensis]MDO3651156.1 hypothetical protein [Nocardia mangyaensis]
MTDYVVGPGGTLPADTASIDAHAMLLGGLPLLVLATRFRVTQIGPYGELVAEDAAVTMACNQGARMVAGLDFSAPELTAGWHVTLAQTGQLIVTAPDGMTVYDGTLAAVDTWVAPVRQAATAGTGLPVAICSAGTGEDALERIATDRAAWVRATIELR